MSWQLANAKAGEGYCNVAMRSGDDSEGCGGVAKEERIYVYRWCTYEAGGSKRGVALRGQRCTPDVTYMA